MGKPSKRRGKKPRAGPSAPSSEAVVPSEDTPSSSTPDLALQDVSISLRAKVDFHEATVGMDSCLTPDPDAATSDEFIRYKLSQWSRKRSVLNWFNAGCAKDSTAELWVDLPSKDGRKEFHRMISKDFKQLKSLSRGLNGERRLLVLHATNSTWDMATLSADDEKKARVLLATLRAANQTCSVDEAKEMIAQNTMTEATSVLLDKAIADQKSLEALLDGIKSSDVAAVRATLAAAPHLLAERIKHYESGDAPLHVACAGGSTTIIKILMEHGADLEQRDGSGRTPLKVALAAEQCDAEGMLIQSGAIDPHADKDLQMELDLEDQQASLDDEQPAAAPAAAAVGAVPAAEACAVVPTTPPQEDTDRATWPAAAVEASEAAAGAGGADAVKVIASSSPAELAGAIKAVTQAAHAAADSATGAEPPAAAVAGETAANGSTGVGPSAPAVTTRSCVPATITEIQPASPRAAPMDSTEDYRMTTDDGQDEKESGIGVLMDYLQDRAKPVIEWCSHHQGVVGTVAVSAAAVCIALVSTQSRRR